MTKLTAWLRANRRHGQPVQPDEVKKVTQARAGERPSQIKETSALERQARNERRRAKYAHHKWQRSLDTEPVYCAAGCGKDLTAPVWNQGKEKFRRKDAEFCSDRCRQAAHRERAVTKRPKKTKEPLRTNQRAVTKSPKSRDTKTKKPLRVDQKAVTSGPKSRDKTTRTDEKAVTKTLKVRVRTSQRRPAAQGL